MEFRIEHKDKSIVFTPSESFADALKPSSEDYQTLADNIEESLHLVTNNNEPEIATIYSIKTTVAVDKEEKEFEVKQQIKISANKNRLSKDEAMTISKLLLDFLTKRLNNGIES